MTKLIELKEILNQIHQDDNDDPEKKWMIEHAETTEVADLIRESPLFTHSELKILTELSENKEAILFKTLQENSELSQGMLSRYIARLAKQKLVEKFYAKENKKSVLLLATARGNEIGKLHQKLHHIQDKKYESLLNRYSDKEISTVMNFLDDVIKTRKEL